MKNLEQKEQNHCFIHIPEVAQMNILFLRNPAVGGESSEEEEEDFRLKAEAHGSIYKDILNQNSH